MTVPVAWVICTAIICATLLIMYFAQHLMH